MTVAAAGNFGIRRTRLASRLVVFIALFAFALQSYIAQTHIHGVSQDFPGVVKTATVPSPAQGKAPLDNSPVDCPFCQTATLAGAYVMSATLLVYLPLGWVKAIILVVTTGTASSIAAHDWQSRAPPQH
jgi:hypothetical protein